VSKESQTETKFGSIEGAAEYLGLLLESVDEARADLEGEAKSAAEVGAERRLQAIQLATYKLAQLRTHLTTSHRLLNDLRTIRRLLFAEREAGPPAGGAESARSTAGGVRQPQSSSSLSAETARPGPDR
jgi:hypothetical protein